MCLRQPKTPKGAFFPSHFEEKICESYLIFIWNKEDVKGKSLTPALLLQNLSWHRLLLPVLDKCCMRNISLINVIFWCFKQKQVTIIKDILQLNVKFLVLGTDFQEYDFNIVHSSVSSWLTKKLRQIVLRQKNEAESFELACHFECLCIVQMIFQEFELSFIFYLASAEWQGKVNKIFKRGLQIQISLLSAWIGQVLNLRGKPPICKFKLRKFSILCNF